MSREMSVLEGSYRLNTITKAKKRVFTIQLFTLIGLTLLLLLWGGMSLQPFYMPIDSFMYFLLIMLLVLMIESFLFRILEIRYTKSGSKKFLMAKNTIKKFTVFAALSLIFAVILLVPFTAGAIESTLGSGGDLTPGVNNFYKVQSRDQLGLTRVTEITISMESNVRGYIYLLKEEDMRLYQRGDATVLNESIRRPLLGTDVIFESFPARHDVYYVIMTSTDSSATVNVDVTTTGSPAFFTLVPIMLLSMMAFSVATIFYMRPKQKLFVEGSIYR